MSGSEGSANEDQPRFMVLLSASWSMQLLLSRTSIITNADVSSAEISFNNHYSTLQNCFPPSTFWPFATFQASDLWNCNSLWRTSGTQSLTFLTNQKLMSGARTMNRSAKCLQKLICGWSSDDPVMIQCWPEPLIHKTKSPYECTWCVMASSSTVTVSHGKHATQVTNILTDYNPNMNWALTAGNRLIRRQPEGYRQRTFWSSWKVGAEGQ